MMQMDDPTPGWFWTGAGVGATTGSTDTTVAVASMTVGAGAATVAAISTVAASSSTTSSSGRTTGSGRRPLSRMRWSMAKYLKPVLQLRATTLSKARLVLASVDDLSSAVRSTLA